MNTDTLQDAYNEADYVIVQTGRDDMYEIPTATPAVFAFDEQPDGRAGDVQARLERGYRFIDAYTQNRSNGGIHISTKVYDSETNQFLKIRMDRNTVRIFPDGKDLTFETFGRFVEHVCDALDTDLEFRPGESE